jgi:septal ring factor EnvC (AmiA/AmiB activator)
MELTVAVAALVIGVVALAMVLPLRRAAPDLSAVRGELDQTRRDLDTARGEITQTRAEITETRGSLERVQRELAETHRELDELKATTEVVPAPPLPKTRPGGLDDLREQLRAAHRESADEPTPEDPTSGE